MGNALRNQPMPTRYGESKTPVTEDVLQVGLLFAFGIIAFSFILIIPGIRGKERIWACIRVFAALWIGAILLVCNFGSWYSDEICTSTQYKAHTIPNSPQLIQAKVGVSISLRGINITLKEEKDGCGSEDYERPFPGEEINYVESFRWAPSWRQGRLDFGEFGGQYRQAFRAAQYRGMPYPITWVAETLLFDGDQFRWYRRFRAAGWYTHIFLWLGFATYLLSIAVFIFSVRHGAYFMFLTGAMMCLAALTYGVVIQNDPPFIIHFPDDVLRPKFNYAFYLTGATGILTIVGACVIVLMDILFPRRIAAFFHHALTLEDAAFEGVQEEDEEEEELGMGRGKRVSLTEGLRKVSLGMEGKVRRTGTLTRIETLTRIGESLRESIRASIRSNRSTGGGRSNVLPRKKSTVSLDSGSTTTSPVMQHVVDQAEVVIEQQHTDDIAPEEQSQSVVEKQQLVTEKQRTVAEKQHSIKEKQRTVAEKQHSIKEKQRTVAEKQHSIKEKQRTVAEKQHSIKEKQKQQSVKEKQQAVVEKQQGIEQKQHIVEQNTMEKQQQGQLVRQEHAVDETVIEMQQSVDESLEQSSKIEQQHSVKEIQHAATPQQQRPTEVELELVPIKGRSRTPVLV